MVTQVIADTFSLTCGSLFLPKRRSMADKLLQRFERIDRNAKCWKLNREVIQGSSAIA